MFAQKEDADSEVQPEESGLIAPSVNGPLDLLINRVNQCRMENCANKNFTALSSEINAEPDSSVSYADDITGYSTLKKSVNSQCDTVKTDSLCPDSVGVDEGAELLESISASALDKKSTAQSIVESNLDSSEVCKNYAGSLRPGCSVITEPIETSIIQNVSKVTKNFTLNVNSGVNIQDVVQNVSGGNQTLWLPTIIAPGNIANADDHMYEEEAENPPSTISQFFFKDVKNLGTGQHYSSHTVNNSMMTTAKPSHMSNNKFPPKVQILGSITIPKPSSLTNTSQSNVKMHGNYLNQNEISNINSSVLTSPSKQIISSAVLNQMNNKIHSANIPVRGPPVHVKSVINSTSIQMKGMPSGNMNRSLNKVNTINNKLESTQGSGIITGQSNHVHSRVLPSPKISLQPTGRVMKSGNIQYNAKPPGNMDQQASSIMHTHKLQSAVPVKIIQQQTIQPGHKTGFKTVQTSRPAIGSSKNITYSSVNALPSKNWSQLPTSSLNHVVNQKQTPTYTKNISGVVNVQKISSQKMGSHSTKMVVHQPSNQIIMQNPAQMNRINAQHYQSNDSTGGIRYIQNYVGLDNNNSTPASSNQNITAQILQSLSQPKILLPSQHVTMSKRSSISRTFAEDGFYYRKTSDQSRQMHGDPNTILNTDDIPGIEERPSLSDDSLPFHYHTLQLVMLDHTYALPSQTITTTPANGANIVTNNTSPINNLILPSPSSPTKVITLSSNSPVNGSISSGQLPVSSMSVILPNNASNIIQNTSSYQYNLPPVEDDDAASIISSIEGDRDIDRPNERHDSDTETAPEGEEEGKTRCVCEFTHDDGYMICCDRCGEWQHVDCMGIDRQNIPDDYMCDRCEPRLIDRKRARSIQIRKREELTGLGSSGSDSSSGGSIGHQRNKQVLLGVSANSNRKRPLTVTTYSNTISGVSRTVPAFPSTFSPPYDVSNTSPLQVKRGPKRPRRIDNGRKGPKRKIPEKRKRKNSEISNYRSKYGSLSTSSHQVNQWTDSFELAVTNHYSPELRAKIARYCSNKGGNNPTNMSEILTAYFCTTVPHAGSKILIATEDLKENTPIVELRGKYMLSTQHKPQPQLSGRVGSQRPGPFLFFYRLPKDSTQICIDTRTYGNEARFVRRSCNPNSELQHFIHKGALHVYLVTLSQIHSNTEISIRHESNGSAQPCACGNPKFCKQGGGVSAPVVHKNNGATFDSVGDRKGRTRLSSSSFSLDHVALCSPTKYDEFSKLYSPDIDKSRLIEMDVDIKQENVESNSPEKCKDDVKSNNYVLSPKMEKNFAIDDLKPKIEEVSSPNKKMTDSCKSDLDIKHMKKDDIKIEDECQSSRVLDTAPNNIKEEDEDEEDDDDDDDDDEPLSKIECKNTNTSSLKAVASTGTLKSKEADKQPKKGLTSRRTSLHCMRTTRASTMMQMNTNESADEKSDSQSDSKSQQSTKEKKKMTREERKMEAIMKAFERMEKAELRKQENKDRQSKRRESDSNPPCGNISINDSKDQNDDQMDDSTEQTIKRRRRKKGRIRTVSQNNQRNRNRLNSIDSDMVTSGEESTSLLSPPNNSNNATNDNYSENVTMASSEDVNYQDQALSDTTSLQQSVRRLNVGLSSACLLVEAAVGPLESTFKFPKTKKDIMNAWLSKSPERHMSYDINHSLDYSNANDNNNSPHPYINNKSLSRDLSLEYLMKATKSLIGNFSGSAVSNESTPEKNYGNEQTEPENLSTFDNAVDSNQTAMSSPTYPSQKGRKVQNDALNDCNSCDKKVPKRYRKGLKGILEERTSPVKRNLRSSTILDNTFECNAIPFMPPRNEPVVPVIIPEVRDAEIAIVPQPPQHSAKKRWLRQAISEESDSPTAESPPNEIVTPLKKRRLARESLSLEPPFTNCDDAQQFTPLGTPKKADTVPVFPRISPGENFKCSVAPKMEVICEESVSQLESPDIKMGNYENSDEHVLNTLAQEIDHNNDKYFPDSVSESTKESNAIDIDEESKNSQCCNEVNLNKSDDHQNDNTILSDLKINFTNFSRLKRSKDYLDSKDDACIEDIIGVNRDYQESDSREIKSEPVSNIHSAETSGNSSPVVDDIDDIKKRIHSFHTENIQILKIRNKKQPKEKRKVNLNFDLCVLADQTVGVKLKTETDLSNKDSSVASESLSQMSEDSPNLDSSNEVNTTIDEKSVMNTSESESSFIAQDVKCQGSPSESVSNSITSPGDAEKGFMCTPLFSGSFKGETNLNSPMPDLNVIKNAINLTTSLEIGIKSKSILNTVDEYKNVQEILSHVNQMDSHNSLLLSGVLRDSNHTLNEAAALNKPMLARSNDPRLNPPPVEKPKPQRRKLSISEYRRRHSMVSSSSTEQDTSCGSISPGIQSNTFSSTADSSTASRTFNASDDLNPDLLQSNENSNLLESFHPLSSDKNECSNLDSNASASSSPGCPSKELPSHCASKPPATIPPDAQVATQSVNISFLNKSPQIRSAR